VSAPNPGSELMRWAQGEPTVRAAILIGSQAREGKDVGGADEHSDWDFQLIVRRPTLFADRAWTAALGCGPVLAYVVREGRLGSAEKVSLLFAGGEIDLVIIPARRLALARALGRVGLATRIRSLRAGLGDLALVLRAGYRFVKGEAEWGSFYRQVVSDVAPPRLADGQVRGLAEGFVCDYVSTLRKIDRGEFLAAQRWLHHQLAETNFRLAHERRQRQGLPSFPDARRIERLSADAAKLTVTAMPDAASLRAAVEKARATHIELVAALVGDLWRWPDLR